MHDPHSHTVPPGTTAAVHAEHGEGHPHVVPLWLLVVIFAALLVLTAITVAARYIEFGELTLAVALIIAFIKATLVVLYFMHLRWDSYFNSVAIIAGLLFVVLFIGITLSDSFEYKPNVDAWQLKTEPATPPVWKPAMDAAQAASATAPPAAGPAPATPAAPPAPATPAPAAPELPGPGAGPAGNNAP